MASDIERNRCIADLVAATNQIHTLLGPTLEPERKVVQQALSIACNTLRRLLDDKQLAADIRAMRDLKSKHREEFNAIVRDVDRFTRSFLPREATLLLSKDLSSKAADDLLQKAAKLQELVAVEELNEERLIAGLRNLKEECCYAANDLLRDMNDKGKISRWRRLGGRAFYGVGGSSIALINAGAFFATAFLTGPYAVVSAVVGAAMITEAFNGDKD